MICPSDHARSENIVANRVFAGQGSLMPSGLSLCPTSKKVVPQVGRMKPLQTLNVSHRPTSLAHSRVRVHTHVHARIEVGRWDTASNGKALMRPTCGTTFNQEGHTMQKPGSKRDQMPLTTAFIDAFRQVFGVAEINASIKEGIAGRPTFYASENGHTIGTKSQELAFSVSGDALALSVKEGKQCRSL